MSLGAACSAGLMPVDWTDVEPVLWWLAPEANVSAMLLLKAIRPPMIRTKPALEVGCRVQAVRRDIAVQQ